MTYIRLEDGFFRNPKARRLGKDGRALYIAGLCHCSRDLTDGVIDRDLLPILLAEADVKPVTVALLVKTGAWVEVNGHYVVHDYLAHQRSRSSVESERERWRDAQRRHRGDSTGEST